MELKPLLYGLAADFDSPEALVEAARRTREAGYQRTDTYTPFPVDELINPEEIRRTGVPLIVLVGGLTGAVVAFATMYYSTVYGYPLNVGGRPLNSWPMYIPITFELTVLFAALAGVVGMFALNRLPMPYHPMFNLPQFDRASQDRFFLCIEAADPKFDRAATKEFLASLNPIEVMEVPE
jgi:hypothetical protein